VPPGKSKNGTGDPLSRVTNKKKKALLGGIGATGKAINYGFINKDGGDKSLHVSWAAPMKGGGVITKDFSNLPFSCLKGVILGRAKKPRKG